MQTKQGAEVMQEHAALESSLQALISSLHAEWYNGADPDLAERLKRPLLCQACCPNWLHPSKL
jgi:hypothetical protein